MIDLTSIDIEHYDFDSSPVDEEENCYFEVEKSDGLYQDDSVNPLEICIPDDFDIDDSTPISYLSESPVVSIENGDYLVHHDHNQQSSNISFTGNGRCRVCNCGGWAGFGDTCENCGHFYNKHI